LVRQRRQQTAEVAVDDVLGEHQLIEPERAIGQKRVKPDRPTGLDVVRRRRQMVSFQVRVQRRGQRQVGGA